MKLATVVRTFCEAEPMLLVSNHNAVTKCKLNKPKGLNSLNLAMIMQLKDFITEWNDDANIGAVLFYGAGSKAFCAGGDVRAIYEAKHGDGDRDLLRDFFWHEYIVDYALAKMRPV
jgi:enoyl-CoA hydratase/carnithine racemase